jgi:hypothetical protein
MSGSDSWMRHLPRVVGFAAIMASSSAWCADGTLAPLTEALAHVRSAHGVNEDRDAGPELTPVKQRLRDWVEEQLPAEPTPSPDQPVHLPGPRDFERLSLSLNKALEDAGLTCGDISSSTYRCAGSHLGEEDDRGYLGDVRVASLDYGRYILVVTGVGVRCGFDESAYIYAQDPSHRWRLLFQTEQDDYGKDEYAPQNFLSINVSPSGVAWNEPASPPLVLALGFSPWCSSNWNSLSTRLWRASGSTPTPLPLLDRNDALYLGDDQIASARLTRRDVLIEFRGHSIDSGTIIRSHVEHFLIEKGGKLERIAPIALSPNDFVEEWLTSRWEQARRWTDPSADKSVSARVHSSLRADFGDFDGVASRCRSHPNLWQVGFAAADMKNGYKSGPESYFLVRWMTPYRFTLVGTQRRPFRRCDERVAMPDDIGTLFPGQGWTR